MNQELTGIQKFSCWLVEKGRASKLEALNYANELFGDDRGELFLMWGLDSGAFYCVDNTYFPNESLKALVASDREHRPEAHKNPLER